MGAEDGGIVTIVDIRDEATFARLPPCADARFDHRSCDYWEDPVRGAKDARPRWWQAPSAAPPIERSAPTSSNPFARSGDGGDTFNPFAASAAGAAPDDVRDRQLFAVPSHNPFAPPAASVNDAVKGPRKLNLLSRGSKVFGSYAKVLRLDGEPAVYIQFGPLTAYPRAQHIRELYPQLPQSPLPAVVTCIAAAANARGRGLATRLVDDVCADLSDRGFSAVEAYPDLMLKADEASAADPGFWEGCGFVMAAADERYPVMRRSL